MKKLLILSLLAFLAVGCADNLDTVPEPVVPSVTVDVDDARGETEESIIIRPKGRPGQKPAGS
uniref:hypothetical protein n=1 Tax=Roseivirga sp. TaxID=1964215 RepID=UPI004047139A